MGRSSKSKEQAAEQPETVEQPDVQLDEQAQADGAVSPEEAHETGNQTTMVEPEAAGERDEAVAEEPDEREGFVLPPLNEQEQQAAIAGSMGGPDNYPYQDRTAIPLHERNLSAVNNPLTEASQAELNPAFTPKAEDGGPVTANDEGVGTEPNVHDDMLAAAQKAEDAGMEGAVERTEQQIQEGMDAQMDAVAVTEGAQERAPEGIDAATGQGEGEATPPGAPSGMEPSSDGEAGVAGAEPENAGEGTSQSDAPEAPENTQ